MVTTRPRIFISHLSTVSALGVGMGGVLISEFPYVSGAVERWGFPVFALSPTAEMLVASVGKHNSLKADRVTELALAVAEKMAQHSAECSGPLGSNECPLGVSIGSSRGATTSLEGAYGEFMKDIGSDYSGFWRGRSGVPVHTSPTTTAGTLSALVAQRLLFQRESPDVFAHSVSMTCSSAFHSLVSGVAFLRSGMVSSWVFGGAEAPLTPFTLAQMDALRIYTAYDTRWPCRPHLDFSQLQDSKSSPSFALGEGAGIALASVAPEVPDSYDFELLGIGWSIEQIPSATGISEDGHAFQEAMRRALDGIESHSIDCIIMHAPGTVKGDLAELRAVAAVFGAQSPVLTSSKHLVGHTFGAAGMLSLEWARQLAFGGAWISTEFARSQSQPNCQPMRRFLINAGGFGGNAISICVEARPTQGGHNFG